MTVADGVVTPAELWDSWTFDPMVVASVALAALVYGYGTRRAYRHGLRTRASARRITSFYAGLLVVAGALVSPLAAASDVLFSAHMVQHLTLITLAAPLLVYGAPRLAFVMALPRRWRRRATALTRAPLVAGVGRAAANPVVVGAAHAAALWAWHLPLLYGAALDSEVLHAVEHATFLGTAVLFWWLVLPRGAYRRVGHGVAMLLVFATGLQSAALGAILTFASRPLYGAHSGTTRSWGLTALEDQQLAGVIMWVPPGIVYLAVVSVLFFGWFRDLDARTRGEHEVGSAVSPSEP